MGTLAISDDLLEKIAAMAATSAITVEKQIEILLEDGIVRWGDRQTLVAELDRIAAMTPKDVVQTDSVVLIREERDR